MNQPPPSAPSLLARLRWPLLASVPVLVLAIWLLGGSGGRMFQGRAGYSAVSGSWHVDAATYEAMVAAKEAYLAGRPGGAVDAKLTAAKLRAIAAPYAKLTLTFTATSYLVADQGGSGSHETACTYEGESPLLLHVIGAEPGEADDLTIVLDPALGSIHLRLTDGSLPYIRE